MRIAGTMIAVAVCVLTGCASVTSAPPADTASDRDPETLPPVADMLFYVDRLAALSAEELEQIPESRPVPNGPPEAVLRHVLWLATPGHRGYNPKAARATLARMTTPGNGLDASTRALVRLELRHLRTRLELAGERTKLVRENARLREQIQALTALEEQMGDDAGEQGGDGPPAEPERDGGADSAPSDGSSGSGEGAGNDADGGGSQ